MVIEADAPIPDWPGLAGRRIALARRGDIVTSPLRQLFDWWQEHAGDEEAGGQPRFADFDILHFARIAPHLYIAAPVEVGFELRLAGEEYIRLFGLKKGWVWRLDALDPVEHDSAQLLSYVSQIKQPIRTIGRLELSERHWVSLEALVCPLAGKTAADGTPEPGRILGCVAGITDEQAAELP